MPKEKWINKSNTPTYFVWRNMRRRVSNPKDASYKHYGERGITVCPQWMASYDQFVADMGECPEGLSLDRTDNDLGYSPENCRWVTMKEQLNNQRRNRKLTLEGKTQNLAQWADELGLATDTLHHRLLRMPSERALTSGSLRPAWRHGTRAGYEAHSCRCESCTASNTARHQVQRAKREARKLVADRLQGTVR